LNILVIEDNPDIVANIYGYFEPLGYELDNAPNGFAGLALAMEREGEYDAIILDVMLPGLDGYQLCQKLRKELKQKTPVLMLTARDSIKDRVDGFESGADDYLIKPFSLIELEARIKALVRRSKDQHIATTLTFGPLRFDPDLHEASRGDTPLALTPTGYKLLKLLLMAAPRLVSRQSLETAIWGNDLPDSDVLRTHMHSLRQSLDKSFDKPMLKTVTGVGYRLVDPDV